MHTIPNKLKRLFEQAGQAEAQRQERERRKDEKRRREIALEKKLERKARALAPAAAQRVWSWLKGPQANELRDCLRTFELREVMILGWLDHRGRIFDNAYYARWRVSLVAKPGTLRVCRIGAPWGGVAKLVTSAKALEQVLPSRVVLALERAIATDRFLHTVRKAVRERTRRNADPPNIIRIL
jgi:hypothetical protein